MKIAVSLVLSLLVGSSLDAQATLGLRWDNHSYAYDELPDELSDAARSAIESWIPWAEKESYRMTLGDEGRTLLLTHADNARWRRQARLVKDSVSFFEESLPRPAGGEGDALAAAAPKLDQPDTAEPAGIPDDPEGGPAPWEFDGEPEVQQEAPKITSYVWGAENLTPDSQTAVFLVARVPSHYTSALSHLAKSYPYLSSWQRAAAKYTGCTLQQPLFGTYIQLNNGQEEWDPDNELVHRIAELLLLRRFGQQPYWIVQAWAWRAEFALRGAVYCYPYRDEFVWASEHTGWDAIVRNRLSTLKKKDTIGMRDFARWKRGTYDDVLAKNAWGVFRFIAEEHGDKLPQFLLELRDIRDVESRMSTGSGTWERKRGFEIGLDTQEKLLTKMFGADLLRQVTDELKSGKRKK